MRRPFTGRGHFPPLDTCAFSRRTSAILYTIIECCRRRGLDPYAYLRDILTRLPMATNWQIKELTPEAWAKERQLTSIPQAA